MTEELGPGMIRVMERIQKLLNLAAKNPNADEAAAAASKAQALLTQYNLDAALVERQTGGVGADGRREEAKTRGGFYHWQRELWEAVARLNFCLHWVQSYRVEGKFRVRTTSRQRDVGYWDDEKRETVYDAKARTTDAKWQRRHRVVGRIVNTRMTIATAQYLEEAIERLARDHIRGDLRQLYSREANSFRYGAMEVIVEKVNARYRQMEKEAEAVRRAAERRAAAAGASTATTVALVDLRKSEVDANKDFLYGEGWSAEQRRAKEEAARQEAEEEAEYAQWADANPEEARAKEEKRRKAARRGGWGGSRAYETKVDGGAYKRGREAAGSVSIDRQAGSAAAAAPRLGRA